MATVSSAGWTGDVGVTDFEVDGKLGVTDLLSSLLSSLSLIRFARGPFFFGEAKRFPRVTLGSLLQSPSGKCRQQTLVLSFTTSTLIMRHFQPKRSSLRIFRYSVERYTWIFRFAITTNDASMACHFSEHCNSSMDYSYNLKQISADSWKTLVLRYALKKKIYGNTRTSRDFEKWRLRFFPSLQYILRGNRSNR